MEPEKHTYWSDLIVDSKSLSNFILKYEMKQPKPDNPDQGYELGYKNGLNGTKMTFMKRSEEWKKRYKQGYMDGTGDRDSGLL